MTSKKLLVHSYSRKSHNGEEVNRSCHVRRSLPYNSDDFRIAVCYLSRASSCIQSEETADVSVYPSSDAHSYSPKRSRSSARIDSTSGNRGLTKQS